METTKTKEKALLLSYWLDTNPSSWVVNRVLEANATEWLAIAKTIDPLETVIRGGTAFRDEQWQVIKIRARPRGIALNDILEKPCNKPCYTCLDGRLPSHPEVSYYIGQRRRVTIAFGQLHSFLVDKVGETISTSRDVMWLISFCVFIANLRGRLVRVLEKLGVVEAKQ